MKADTVNLRDGRILEGYYLGDTEGAIRFSRDGVVEEIPRANVVRVTIGYGGVPICYQLAASPEVKRCDARLRSLDSRELVIAGGKGFTESQTLQLRDFAALEFSRKEAAERLIPTLKPGSRLSLTLADARQVVVTVLSSESNRLRIEDASGSSIEILEEQIIQATLPSPKNSFVWSSLLPGFPQYARGERNKAFLIAGTFGLSFLGALAEERAARRDARVGSQDLLYNILGVSPRVASFRQHRRNAQMLALVGAGVYGFHLRDVFATRRSGHMRDETQIAVHFSVVNW